MSWLSSRRFLLTIQFLLSRFTQVLQNFTKVVLSSEQNPSDRPLNIESVTHAPDYQVEVMVSKNCTGAVI